MGCENSTPQEEKIGKEIKTLKEFQEFGHFNFEHSLISIPLYNEEFPTLVTRQIINLRSATYLSFTIETIIPQISPSKIILYYNHAILYDYLGCKARANRSLKIKFPDTEKIKTYNSVFRIRQYNVKKDGTLIFIPLQFEIDIWGVLPETYLSLKLYNKK